MFSILSLLQCSYCRPKVNNCPMCRSESMDNRNLLAERLLEQRSRSGQAFPCWSALDGCTFRLPIPKLILHEDMCVYRRVPCPGKHRGACSWTGKLHELIRHVVATKCVQVGDRRGVCICRKNAFKQLNNLNFSNAKSSTHIRVQVS